MSVQVIPWNDGYGRAFAPRCVMNSRVSLGEMFIGSLQPGVRNAPPASRSPGSQLT